MIIIVDSGSTKADWHFVKDKKTFLSISTMGINPVFHNTDAILNILQTDFAGKLNAEVVSHVYFYGAGCSSEKRCSVVSTAIKKYFKNSVVEVHPDILAAARATCGNTAGIACILGTGSNSCLYDGEKIIDNLPSLGFIIGDEGSGSYLGKMLLKKFFYRELPKDLSDAFHKKFNLSKEDILDSLYNKPQVNIFLAKFSLFFSDNSEHPAIREMIKVAFTDFYSSLITKYDGYKNLPVHFVGSISFIFRDVLENVSKEFGTTIGKTIKQPIDELVNFHLQHLAKEKN